MLSDFGSLILMSAGELGKLLGIKWKELDEEEKRVRCLVGIRTRT